jgi:hypothetical protein
VVAVDGERDIAVSDVDYIVIARYVHVALPVLQVVLSSIVKDVHLH